MPIELCHEILNHVGIADLRKYCLVCKRWQKYIKSITLICDDCHKIEISIYIYLWNGFNMHLECSIAMQLDEITFGIRQTN